MQYKSSEPSGLNFTNSPSASQRESLLFRDKPKLNAWRYKAVVFAATASSNACTLTPDDINICDLSIFSFFTNLMEINGWRCFFNSRIIMPKNVGCGLYANHFRAHAFFQPHPVGGADAFYCCPIQCHNSCFHWYRVNVEGGGRQRVSLGEFLF